MKHCPFCNTDYELSESNCPSCSAAEAKTKCDNCGSIHGSAFCPDCGMGANEKFLECPKCGTRTKDSFCSKCGYSFVASDTGIKAALGGLVSKASCMLGHDWFGCKCRRCGAVRDEGHNWQPFGGKCRRKCSLCGEVEEKHAYAPEEGRCEEKCAVCGEVNGLPHKWSGAKCKRCGELKDVRRTKSWFAILMLALFFCAGLLACLIKYFAPVLMLLVLFFPIGLIGLHAMWKYQRWNTYVKIGITVLFGALFILCFMSMN